MVDKYQAERMTSALTICDIQQFIDKHPAYKIEPLRVLKYIIMGNACAGDLTKLRVVIVSLFQNSYFSLYLSQ
jgi:hypothetical protein